MATINTDPARLVAALTKAQAGDVFLLAPGSYGDVAVLRRQVFAEPIRIASADPANPAQIRSFSVRECEGVEIEGVVFALKPDEATTAGTPVIWLYRSKRVSIRGGSISAGLSVSGVLATAERVEAGNGNVIGWPTAVGVNCQESSEVLIEGVDIHDLHTGVVINGGPNVAVRGNAIHHLRKTGVKGGCDDLVIEDNYLHSNRPWRYGQTPWGDHGDFIAVWNGGATRMKNIAIRGNKMETGEGLPMMGGWVHGGTGGIEGLVYSGNAVIGGDHQAFAIKDVFGGLIESNVMLQDVPGAVDLGIIIGDRTENVTAKNNIAGSVSDKLKGATGNVVEGNTVVQMTKPAAAGFFGEGISEALKVLKSPASIYDGMIRALRPTAEGPTDPPITPPTRDELREILAVRTEAKLEPLKTKGRLIVNFKTPAQGEAALAAVLAVKF